ncbi:MAG: hypothetical protein WAO12_11535 [Venatoribacter sp.]
MNIHEIRQKNFLYLASKYNGRAAFAEKLGYNDASYINQIASGHINMGPSTAKKIEAAENLSEGWMNHPHPELWGRYELADETSLQMKEKRAIGEVYNYQLDDLSNEELAGLLIKISEVLKSRL